MADEREYPVVLRPLAPEDGGGWIALVPDLPGCMSDGASADEALRHVKDAIEEWKDAAQRMRRPVPRPDDSLDRSLETDVPEHVRKQAEAYARSLKGTGEGRADPAVVHAIISEWMRKAVHRVRLVPNRT
jgi:predicted RNase H-like HicB family nuclease